MSPEFNPFVKHIIYVQLYVLIQLISTGMNIASVFYTKAGNFKKNIDSNNDFVVRINPNTGLN